MDIDSNSSYPSNLELNTNNPTSDKSNELIDSRILPSKINRGTHVNNFNNIRNSYYDEWMIKTISWIAMNIGFKRIDISAIELLTSYTINLIQDIGRRAQNLARIRSSESCNYIDAKTVVQNIYPKFYNEIFINGKFLSLKPIPTTIPPGNYHAVSQPALLCSPSFLYYECLLSAGDSISNIMSKKPKIIPENENQYTAPINIAQHIDSNINQNDIQDDIEAKTSTVDIGSIGVYVAGGYSASDEPLYQKLAMSRRKFCHKHFPILPIESFRDNKDHSNSDYSYVPLNEDSTQVIERQKIILQSELPEL